MTGNVATSSDPDERIAVERTTANSIAVWLVDRKVKVSVVREDAKYWLKEVVWCGATAGACDDVWKRTDAQWRSDNSTANHTGYAVYRDSLRIGSPSWTDPVPYLEFGKKKWDKGLCENGICFLVSVKDSSVAHGAAREDGSVVAWDGGYIKGGAGESQAIHAFDFLLEKGRDVPGRKNAK